MDDKLKFILGIITLVASVFVMVLLFILLGVMTNNYLGGDLSNLWTVLAEDALFSLASGALLTVGGLMIFPILVGALLIYRKGYRVKPEALNGGVCAKCKSAIPGIWHL